MPEPTRVCIEDLAPPPDGERVLVCTALAGRQPGLGFAALGAVCWRGSPEPAAELWVNADDRLALYVRSGSPPVTLQRGGRRLTAPSEHPIVVLDGDLVSLAGRRYLLHVHGPIGTVAAPTPLRAAVVGTSWSPPAAVARPAAEPMKPPGDGPSYDALLDAMLGGADPEQKGPKKR